MLLKTFLGHKIHQATAIQNNIVRHTKTFIKRGQLIFLFLSLFHVGYAQVEAIVPAGDWRDTQGNLIAATEGGIIKVNQLYYLWGMDRSKSNYAFVGVNLYSSPDLKNWTFVNQILKSSSHVDLSNSAVVERAKLLHNAKTGQFILWMHYEGHNAYSVAEVAYATCATIGGNYTFQSHFRPLSIDSRDMNVYQDDDGKAYLICTTFGNQNVSLFELDASYTSIVKETFRGAANTNNMQCEGHAIIKTGGYYFWAMSLCTGWDFNDNHYFYAKSLAGPWTSGGNIATTNTHTYESQVGFAVQIPGTVSTTYLYMGDRWSVQNFAMSRIVLLPMTVSGTKLSTAWYDQWTLNAETGAWAPGAQNFIDGVYKITAKHSGLALGTNGSAIEQQTYTGATTQLWRVQNQGASFFRITSVESGKVIDINGASRDVGANAIQYAWNDGSNQKWQINDCGGGYHRLVNVNTLGKALEIANSSKTVGTDATLNDFSYGANQLWQFTAVNANLVSSKSYKIVNHSSGKVLDAGSGGEATPIVQTTSSNASSQVWILKDLNNSYYSITNAITGKALDNLDSTSNLAQIKQRTPSTSIGQQWQILDLGNGYYKLMNRISGKLLDNNNSSMADGNIMVQYSDYSSTNTNQQWSFQPASVVTGLSEEAFSSQVFVYPNPVKDKLTIQLGEWSCTKLSLTDAQGKNVREEKGTFTGSMEWPVSALSSGVYFLTMEGENERVVKAVMVQ
jgi:hypothetical protein